MFRLRLPSPADYFALLLVLAAWGLSIFLALRLHLYYDEAYTYLGTGRWQGVHKAFLFRLANVHLLNSMLMAISTAAFPYQVWAIRLPALLSALAYGVLAYRITAPLKGRFFALGLLLFFDQLLLFHSLGRGYGLAATLILAGLYVYCYPERFQRPWLWWAWLLMAALYANFAVLPLLLVWALVAWRVDWQGAWPPLGRGHYLALGGLSLLAVFGLYRVSQPDKPLYGAYQQDFITAVPQDLIYHFSPYLSPSWLLVLLFSIFFLLYALWVTWRRWPGWRLLLVLLGSLLLIYLLARLGHKPLATGRVLLPYWPFLVLAALWPLEKLWARVSGPWRSVLGAAFAGMCLVNAYLQLPWAKLAAAPNENDEPVALALAYGRWESEREYRFYLEKEWREGSLLMSLRNQAPADSGKRGQITWRSYASPPLHRVVFPARVDSLQLHFYRQGTIRAQRNLALNEHSHRLPDDRQAFMLSPLQKQCDSLGLQWSSGKLFLPVDTSLVLGNLRHLPWELQRAKKGSPHPGRNRNW